MFSFGGNLFDLFAETYNKNPQQWKVNYFPAPTSVGWHAVDNDLIDQFLVAKGWTKIYTSDSKTYYTNTDKKEHPEASDYLTLKEAFTLELKTTIDKDR